MRRLLVTRRRLRDLVLVLVGALVLVGNAGCAPPRNGAQIAKNHAWMQLKERGWIPQAQCLVNLWQAESGWNVYAMNPSTGAYGIPQALPGKRMASVSNDWLHNPATQVRWGLDYIKQRYGGPCNAWRHFQQRHWYVQQAPPAPAAAAPAAGAPAAVAPASQLDNASVSN